MFCGLDRLIGATSTIVNSDPRMIVLYVDPLTELYKCDLRTDLLEFGSDATDISLLESPFPLYTGGVGEESGTPSHIASSRAGLFQYSSSHKCSPSVAVSRMLSALCGFKNPYSSILDMVCLTNIPDGCLTPTKVAKLRSSEKGRNTGARLWDVVSVRRDAHAGIGDGELRKIGMVGLSVADAPLYTTADIVTSSRGKALALPTSGVGGSSQPETSEESTDSFYETAVLNSEDAKRWYVPRWNITNGHPLLDDAFFLSNVWFYRICLGLEVRSRAEHELEFKEKLRVKYDARGVLLREKDAEIAKLKSLLKEEENEVPRKNCSRLRDQKDTDISLFDSRASYLKSALDDSQAACDEARSLISSLSSERDGIASEYQGILGHALGRAVDYGYAKVYGRHETWNCWNSTFRRCGYDPELQRLYFDPWPRSTLRPNLLSGCNACCWGYLFILCLLNVSQPTEASTSAVAFRVVDLDTDEDLGSVVCMPHLEDPRFEILP
ncbi:hypothetical protein Tco_1334993 [Tanacetum coccineum]